VLNAATMAVDQHAVCVGKSIPVQTWSSTSPQDCITVQEWNILQGGQVHYTDAAVGHHMTIGSYQHSSFYITGKNLHNN